MQGLTTSSPDGKAGLMLRQSNDPTSAYVFVAVTPNGVKVESTEGGNSSPAHVSGSNAAAPVWLKLERKEEGVHVYESDDGVNWVLITSVALTLNHPFNIGLAAYTSVGSTQTLLEQVQFFLTANEAQKDIGPAGGAIHLQNGSAAGVQPGALTSEVNVRFGVENNPSVFYPSAFDDYWPGNPDLISQIGDPVTLKLPKSAVDFDQRIVFTFILSTPRADTNCSLLNDGCGVEVRFKLKDGTFAYYLDQFQEPDRGFFITGATLKALEGELPAELEIQLNPIDWSSWVTSGPQLGSQGVRTQSAGEFGETLGLFHLGSNYDHSSFEAACRFPQTMPVQEATAADVPKDKTPLILIHGYQAAGNTFDSAFSELPGPPKARKNYNVPLCGWEDAIELFADEDNLSLAQTSLREELRTLYLRLRFA